MCKKLQKNFFFFLLVTLFSISVFGGTIPFVTTWKVDDEIDELGERGYNTISIPFSGAGFNYTVDWGDGFVTTNTSGPAIHTYATPGIYTISITGDLPFLAFSNNSRLLTIEQWGNNQWLSLAGAFSGCFNLQGNFTDSPDLSKITNLEFMFYGASKFNHNINNWDVSNVTNMQYMFSNANAFNQNLNSWDVSKVTNMEAMSQMLNSLMELLEIGMLVM